MLENLKFLRKNKGITQRQLADAIGISQQSINKYENHNIEPDIKTLIQIANYFNTSVDYLIGNTNIQHKIEFLSPYDLNNEESVLMNNFRHLSSTQRRCILTIIDSYLTT